MKGVSHPARVLSAFYERNIKSRASLGPYSQLGLLQDGMQSIRFKAFPNMTHSKPKLVHFLGSEKPYSHNVEKQRQSGPMQLAGTTARRHAIHKILVQAFTNMAQKTNSCKCQKTCSNMAPKTPSFKCQNTLQNEEKMPRASPGLIIWQN